VSGKAHIVFGRQGAGKSTYSKKLSKEVKGVHFSIDEWMWKLYGQDLPKAMNLKWIMERVDRCEQQIWAMARQIAACGVDVVLDLGFTKRAKRAQFLQLAEAANIPTQIHYIEATHAIRKERVANRNKEKGETYAFEVTPDMFDFMDGEFHPPGDEELMKAIVIDTNPTEAPSTKR
jgi:predicted kinase